MLYHAKDLTMEIHAAYRLYSHAVRAKLIKPSVATLNSQAEALEDALIDIGSWYKDNGHTKVINAFMPACKTLVELFGYTPYVGNVYRIVQNLPENLAEKLSEGSKLTLRTGLNPLQSWSASQSGALYFYLNHQFAVNTTLVRLISSGNQVASTEWLLSVVDYMKSFGTKLSTNLRADALRYLEKQLLDFAREDEVVMLLPKDAKVEVMALLNWPDKRKIVRTKNALSR